MNNKKVAIICSYLLIVVDIVVGILFVPFLLKNLGDSEYGLYKLMLSTASYLSVLDFGIGATITRYVVKFKTEGKRREEENFVAMGLCIYGVLAVIVLILSVCINFAIPHMYSASIPAAQMGYARVMFVLLCVNTAINLVNHAYTGLLHAYERFVYSKLINIVKIFLRIAFIVVGVMVKKSALVVVITDVSLSLICLICNALYTRYNVKCKIKLHKWDGVLAKETFVFTFAIFIQAIINQFNTNVDSLVLGVYTTTATIAMYSVALQLYTMYSTLSTAISSVYLPSLSRSVFEGASDDEITKKVIEPSRIQLVILLLALSGYFLFGCDFIKLWVGEEFLYAFVIGAVLLTASTLELSQNTITAILKAKNILHGKTIILAISTAFNAALTFVLVPKIGAIGAAIGTAFSMVFGYGVALNIYYQKAAKINLKLYYKKTYRGILIAAAISTVLGYFIAKFIDCNGYLDFILEAGIYVVIYGAFMLLIGLNKQEKAKILGKLNRKK